jgi:hypothetical protein
MILKNYFLNLKIKEAVCSSVEPFRSPIKITTIVGVNRNKNTVNQSTGPHNFNISTNCYGTATPATHINQSETSNDYYHKSRLSTNSFSRKSKRRYKSLPNIK